MDPRIIGLRSQDVYAGLQTVDQTSGLIAAEFDTTRLAGMAATVAANIKGIDVISDAKALRVIAAQQWGIDSMVLPGVLRVLEEVGYITIRRDVRGNIASIDETVPLLHDDLYERMGEHWAASSPTELDEAAVTSLESLASAPLRLSELIDLVGGQDTADRLLKVGEAAQFARRLILPDGDELIWSPFCAYEQPESLSALFHRFPDEEVRQRFGEVKKRQGLLLDGDPLLNEAVGQGILLANTVIGSGGKAAFAFVPYRASPAQRRMEKVVLQKALILLACVRYGQHKAKNPIHWPDAILAKLQRGESLSATTEAGSQYLTAAQEQILRLEASHSAGYYRATLIDTPDNKAAIALARDLLAHGEPVTTRDDAEQRLLFTGGKYLTPLMTMKERRQQAELAPDAVLAMLDTFRGESHG